MNYNLLKRTVLLALTLVVFVSVLNSSSSTNYKTYYVDGNAVDNNGDGTENSPKKYITSGITLLSSGDTLIIKDGIYTGAINMIGDYAEPRVFPPSGTKGSYTNIKAEHEGKTIIDGQYQTPAFSTVNNNIKTSYLRIEGIHFRNGSCSVFNLKGDYNKVVRCGFEDGQAPDNEDQCPIAVIGGGSSYSLVEDSWIWGKGRYGLYTSSPEEGTHHIIFRRVVVRQDNTPLHGPASAISFYNSHDNVAQNVIVLDSNINPDTTYINGAFGVGGASTTDAERNHSYYGVIALNNKNYAGFAPYRLGSITFISNSIFWDNGNQGLESGPTDSGTINIDHVTSGFNGLSGYKSNQDYNISWNIKNSISVNNIEYGYSYIDKIDHVNTFSNGSGECNNCSISNGLNSNPLTVASGFINPSLKYLPRIEIDSNLKGAGISGSDIGANILYKIGAYETLYGEPGWNEVTSIPLWPFSNERLWTDKLQAYSKSGSSGNRGFASSSSIVLNGLSINVGVSQTPLTDYIWSYLGNQKPDIYTSFISSGSIIEDSGSGNGSGCGVLGSGTDTGSGVSSLSGGELGHSGILINLSGGENLINSGSILSLINVGGGGGGGGGILINLSDLGGVNSGSFYNNINLESVINSGSNNSNILKIKHINIPKIAAINFTDISSSFARADIEFLLRNGVIKGFSDGTFRPNSNTTRAEFLAMTMKALDIALDKISQTNFTDIPKEGSWMIPYIEKAKEYGIKGQIINGSLIFRPNDLITRAEAIAMLLNVAKINSYLNITVSSFQDVKVGWMIACVEKAKNLGIISGQIINGKLVFRPNDPITRAETARIIVKILDIVK